MNRAPFPAGALAAGALVGLMAGVGLLLVLRHVPWRRAPSLDDRLAPYLRSLLTPPGPEVAGPTGVLALGQGLLGPALGRASLVAERISGSNASVRRRLEQLGGGTGVEQFRVEQVLAGAAGAGAGAALGVLTAVGRGFSPIPLVGLVIVGALLGVLAPDQRLSRRIRRREQRILAEFPPVAEILALAVAAGEGPMGALDRVARTCRGDLAAELRRTLADARTGMSLVEALNALARRTTVPSLARFVDGLAVAIDRGTPLAEVLRAQAQDVRELTRRRLLESGGRKEIGMMVPVVFLILPITVLFAIYPGLAVLDLNV